MDLQNQTLDVIVRNPDNRVFTGQAVAVSSVNQKGPFDILPYHENFISIIKDHVTIYLTQEKTQTIPVEKGILKVFENTIEIYLGVEAI